MRYGGDEFIMIASGKRSGLDRAIQQGVDDYNSNGRAPFTLSLSIGIKRATPDDADRLDQFITAADTEMYEHKAQSKQKRHS